MKKYLSLLLVFIFCLGCFVGCNQEEVDSSAATLDDAVTYLQSLYKDGPTNTPRSYDMPAKVMIGTTAFTVTWKVSIDAIKVVESPRAGFWTITVPEKNETEQKYTLTATIKDADGNTKDVTFNRVLPVVDNKGDNNPEADKEYKLFMIQVNVGKVLYAIQETQDDKYLKTTDDINKAATFKVEEVEGGVKMYTMINGVKSYVYAHTVPYEDGSGKMSKYLCYSADNASVWTYQQKVNAWFTTCADGTTYVMGTYSSFETFCISESTYISETNTGVTQFPAELLEAGKDAPEMPKPDSKDPAADSTLTVKQAIDLGMTKISDQYTQGKYYVTGVITEVYNEQYGNMKISDSEGNILTVYGTYSADGSTRYDSLDVKPVAGDTVKIYGIIGQFKDTPQIKNGWIVEHTPVGGTPDTPDTPDTPTFGVISAPVAGTAYKFGMVQGNVGKTYYLAGGMDGYYMATTDDASKAINVYLEETNGGYYLYTMVDGAKTYINMVVSGTHVNGAYEATASSVYTWDAENNTIISVVNDADYWFGTRNDKTYTTVGPCATSYNGFFCQFYA